MREYKKDVLFLSAAAVSMRSRCCCQCAARSARQRHLLCISFSVHVCTVQENQDAWRTMWFVSSVWEALIRRQLCNVYWWHGDTCGYVKDAKTCTMMNRAANRLQWLTTECAQRMKRRFRRTQELPRRHSHTSCRHISFTPETLVYIKFYVLWIPRIKSE